MLPTHLGRFVAFFQNISSLLQVMSTRYYCFNYVITITGRNQFHPIISPLQFSPWEQIGGQSPRSVVLAPSVEKCSDCIPGGATHCFNELPDCDSAAHFQMKKKNKNQHLIKEMELSRDKVSPDIFFFCHFHTEIRRRFSFKSPDSPSPNNDHFI